MEKKINKRLIIICTVTIVVVIGLFLAANAIINTITINKEMKTAEHAITITENVHMYSSAKEKKKYENIKLGTDVYVLKQVVDKDGKVWNKIKVGKKVGYVPAKNIGKYSDSYQKRDLMLDVSKFNLQNNFSTIGEFKAFVINNNIKFVYIRAGGRGYGQAGNFYTDPNADEYAKACEFLNIPFGYYFLEEAINDDEVEEEVNFINQYLNNHNYKNNVLPVALDVEKHAEKGRADEIWDKRYELVNELISKLEENNKKTILYSNASITNKYLSDVNAKMWLAYYPNLNEIPSYWYNDTTGEGSNNSNIISKLIGWQFTHTGIKNIIDEKVDLSIVYSDYLLNDSMDDVENDIKENKNKVFGPINNLTNRIDN